MTKRAALYLRVSTDQQTTLNQRLLLEEVAQRQGWQIVRVYEDAGISGSKGRDQRPGFNELMIGVARKDFDIIMAVAVDRLGRSLSDLVGFLEDVHSKQCDLYLHQQGLSTDTPTGRLLFQLLGVFSQFESSMIRARVSAGLSRAKAAGVRLGRPPLAPIEVKQIRRSLDQGLSIRATAKRHNTSSATVMRVKQQTHVSQTGRAAS